MSPLRYVCLSDLHLGATSSVLTHIGPAGEDGGSSRTLAAFGRALRQTVSHLGDGPLPRLVLLGDVLDLGLSPMADAALAYERFMGALFPAGEVPVFASDILLVPGNHDHHLWHQAKDQYLLRSLDTPTPLQIDCTPLFATASAAGVESELLRRLTARCPGLQDARVDVAYPNLGLVDAAQTRCVLLHHGHYTESVYRLMSTLDSALLGKLAAPKSIAQVERQNGPWVDFLWSGFGSAGFSATMVNTLYEVLCDAGASRQLTRRIARGVLDKLADVAGIGPQTPAARGMSVKQCVLGLVDATVGRAAQSERHGNLQLMSPAGVADLRWYLSGPLRAQLRDERPGFAGEVSFVFGHTHKPFQDELEVEGYDAPVAVYNTGGWVMDQPTMSSTQGASAVFIDADLNVASLRLFNDAPGGTGAPVHAAGVGGFRDLRNPLLDAMVQALALAEASWDQFSRSVNAACRQRADGMLDKFFPATHVVTATQARAS
jgi:hypothetical protein